MNVEHLLSHNMVPKNLPPTVVRKKKQFFVVLLNADCFLLGSVGELLILLDLTDNNLMKLPPELGELVYCLKQIKLADNPLVHPLSK